MLNSLVGEEEREGGGEVWGREIWKNKKKRGKGDGDREKGGLRRVGVTKKGVGYVRRGGKGYERRERKEGKDIRRKMGRGRGIWKKEREYGKRDIKGER